MAKLGEFPTYYFIPPSLSLSLPEGIDDAEEEKLSRENGKKTLFWDLCLLDPFFPELPRNRDLKREERLFKRLSEKSPGNRLLDSPL